MKVILFGIFILLFLNQGLASDIKLEIGWKVPDNLLNCKDKVPLYQTSTDIFDPFITEEIDDVFYTIAYDNESHLITYINTSDFDFNTKDNFRVGDIVELSRKQISFFPKWEIYAPTTIDGWKPVIGYDRPTKIHKYKSGQIIEPGDPFIGHQVEEEIKVKILSFSKTR